MTPPLPGWESKAETGLIAEPRRAHAAKKFFFGSGPAGCTQPSSNCYWASADWAMGFMTLYGASFFLWRNFSDQQITGKPYRIHFMIIFRFWGLWFIVAYSPKRRIGSNEWNWFVVDAPYPCALKLIIQVLWIPYRMTCHHISRISLTSNGSHDHSHSGYKVPRAISLGAVGRSSLQCVIKIESLDHFSLSPKIQSK